MKLKDIISTAIGNSFRSRLRTTLTVIAIFVGAFTLTLTSSIGTGITSYIDTQVASIGASNVLTVRHTTEDAAATTKGPAVYDPATATAGGTGAAGFPGGGGAFLPAPLTDADLASIGATTGILSVDPIVNVSPSYIQSGSGDRFQVSVSSGLIVGDADLAAGAQLSASGGDEVLLPTSYVDALGFASPEDAVGKVVMFGIPDYQGVMHDHEATIVGVQNETLFGDSVTLGQGLTGALLAIQDTGRPENVRPGYFAANATIATDATDAQVAAIKADLADQGFAALTVKDQIGTVQTVIDAIVGVLNAFAIIALVAAAFGIVNTLLMSVQERTREIGLMKAMGMSGKSVFAMFSAEAVFIGFLGSAIGAAVATVVGSIISGALSRTVLSGLEGLQVMQFAPSSIGLIMLVVMAIAFLAGTLPARQASRQDPIDALRYE